MSSNNDQNSQSLVKKSLQSQSASNSFVNPEYAKFSSNFDKSKSVID